jgi:DNA-binding transcriptional MerR regulator
MGTALTVKGASEASGLPVETIRYYERVGVLPPVPRSTNGYRSYATPHVETLRFARSLRDLGLSPAAMGALVTLFHGGTCAAMQGALTENIGEALMRLEAQREDLERTETHLRQLLGSVRNVTRDGRPGGGPPPCPCVTSVEGKGKSVGGVAR